MKVGTLVYYNGPKHYTLDHIGRAGIVIKDSAQSPALGFLRRRRVVFGGNYVCNISVSELEVISESR